MALPRIAVVMAGGSGERFWPMSQPSRPKQLLHLTRPDMTMLEEAIVRIQPAVDENHVFVSTSTNLQEPISDSGYLPKDRILAEPMRRNTLGALCWVVASLRARGIQDAVVAIVTSDHRIGIIGNFLGSVTAAMDVAEDQGGIVTIGVPADRPETGYGYIELNSTVEVQAKDGRTVNATKSFREKPNFETALQYVEAGNFLWNSGMFFFTLSGFLDELDKTQPEAYASTLLIGDRLQEGDVAAATEAFSALPNISVDYAVMEKAEKLHTVRADFEWDDVGSWDSLERSFPLDETQNVSQGDVVMIDCKGSIVTNATENVPVGVIGLDNVIVIATKDGILVCAKDKAQQVRQIADHLRKRNR